MYLRACSRPLGKLCQALRTTVLSRFYPPTCMRDMQLTALVVSQNSPCLYWHLYVSCRCLSLVRRLGPRKQCVCAMHVCCCLPVVRDSNVQQTGIFLGLVVARFLDGGHAAVSIHLLQVRQEDQGPQPIRHSWLGGRTLETDE
ncbi:uncharacterized protein LY79DRAFT_334815 [Colletotrichum navitas]|uniref:Uncharacterized protein n=1 Tax=Colletotrichum navitas TaxID=681940 RepID=A0AAD8V2I4_9PEZI|nr:uncharacterized protein LY79DRAFT_334815 [Colletotrichum navitas]KAK1579774.1 hypothetical protein LY79DRAFT_334815 [Colletotrichum navitas]